MFLFNYDLETFYIFILVFYLQSSWLMAKEKSYILINIKYN